MVYIEFAVKIEPVQGNPRMWTSEMVYNFKGIIHSRFLPLPFPFALSKRVCGHYEKGTLVGRADLSSWIEDPD